jgi:hypothetical protein
MKIENIFTEFMALYYRNNGVKPSSLKDIALGSGVIARCSDLGCTIYYLTTGNYIRIPWEIMDIFYSLNTYSGNRILSLEPSGDIERFIWEFTKFVGLLNNNAPDSVVIPVFTDILDLGTKKFREWYFNKFNKKLEAIEFFSPDKNFEI